MCERSRRNAWLVAAAVGVGALEAVWRANASPPDPRIVHADFGTSAIITGIVSLIGWLAGSQRGRVDGFVARALDGIKDGVSDLADKVIEGALIVAWQFARLWDWLKKHVARIARELYDIFKASVVRVSRILDKIIGPIIDFLDKVRTRLLEIYRDYIKPILEIIEFIRIPLRILSAFNVEWAKRLDATLANLEDWITDNFNYVLGKVNQAINVLNEIVDVTGLLKRFTLVRSIMRDLNLVMALWWNRSHMPLIGDPLSQYLQPFEGREIPPVNAEARAYIEVRQGPDRGRIDEHWDDLRLRLEQY